MKHSRCGFTVVELLIATAISGIIAAAFATTFVREQRFYSASQEQIDLRNKLREASTILAAEVKGAAVSELGVPFMSDTALELFTSVGSSAVCTVSGSTIGFPPQALARGNTLTSLVVLPDTGDIALIYGSPYNQPDSGRWEPYRIASLTSRSASAACPSTTGFTLPADVATGISSWQLIVSTAPSPNVRVGAPVHFVRRARYSIYKSGSDWYVGYRRCNPTGTSVCGSIQPVSGPYHSYSSGAGGLSFRYYDRSGASIAQAQSIALSRVQITLRSAPTEFGGLRGSGPAGVESLTVQASPRNRLR